MSWVIATVILGLSAFLVWASADVGSQVYVRALCRGKTRQKHLSLTFDDGPDADMTPRVLDILRRHNLKATFFLVGSKVQQHPELVRRMVAEGHIVGNHTFFHRSTFPLNRCASAVKELEQCSSIIMKVTGNKPRLFRPPFGVTNPTLACAARKLNLLCVGWSIRSLDTIREAQPARTVERISKRLHPGAVILLHDRCRNADLLLESLITEIQNQGYQIIPSDHLLHIEPYEP